jgi:serine/threonine protein kinase/tetratricopeptide (TPR) repeat protein
MTGSTQEVKTITPDDPRVIAAVEEYVSALEAGEHPNRAAFLARHADVGSVLAGCLEGLQFMRAARPELDESGTAQADPAAAAPLGDFRIIREVGRGGMGIVYEAEQLSLGRRVALKVLPFAATLDHKQIQRFKNEAAAAGQLHHNHIVAVHFVGCERGVHFYAMQFIDGQSLAEVISDLRLKNADLRKAEPAASATLKSTINNQKSSTLPTVPTKAYFHAIARLGIDAALALEHAHELGVVHRDIKPSNLMLDSRGHLWVTDFGLAQIQGDNKLTMTGDLLGTLRYMSPEQALAKRVIVDQRTDVYSLGATLYELMTLQPVFAGADRQELLRQIAFEEPKQPRRLNKTIPAELETIVLKALEKNPAERFATAKELADDLERFAKDEPIRARRPSLARRVRGWARRHKLLVTGAAVFCLTAIVLGGAAILSREQQRAIQQAEMANAATLSLEEADRWEKVGRWPEALAAATRAVNFLGDDNGNAELRARALKRRDIIALFVHIDEIRMEMAVAGGDGGPTDLALGDKLYATAFREYGLDLDKLEPEEAARQLPAGALREELAGALDDWAVLRRTIRRRAKLADDRPWQRILDTARIADPHPVRNRARDLWTQYDAAASKEMRTLPQENLNTRSFRMFQQVGGSLFFFREFQRRRPDDFWINYGLGSNLTFTNAPTQMDEASGYLRVALALRPDHPNVLAYLGKSLLNGSRPDQTLDEGVVLLESAIKLKPDLGIAYDLLGDGLSKNGKLERAAAVYREAVHANIDAFRKYPDYIKLGQVLLRLNLLDRAGAAYSEAIAFDGKKANGYLGMGAVMRRKGMFAESNLFYRTGLERMAPKDSGRSTQEGLIKQNLFFLDMERRLPSILAGQETASVDDLLEVAVWWVDLERFATAAFVYQKALVADDPGKSLLPGHRYEAAFAAVQGGCGQGTDSKSFTDEQRGQLRTQALARIKADLDLVPALGRSGNVGKKREAVERMAPWVEDRRLKFVRDPDALNRLPEEEAQSWRQLWASLPKLHETRLEGRLTSDNKSKAHEVPLKSGSAYIFDLESKAFDCFLLVENAQKKLQAENDDAPNVWATTDSRVFFAPPATGTYRLVAGSFGLKGVGPYVLRIRELK